MENKEFNTELSLLLDIDVLVSPSTGQPAMAELAGWPGDPPAFGSYGLLAAFPTVMWKLQVLW